MSKKLATKKKTKAWAISREGSICTGYIASTRRGAVQAFEANIVKSETHQTIKDFPLYRPIKILIEVA